MTTETKRSSRDSGLTVLLGAAVAATLLGLVLAVVGGLVDGRSGFAGAAVGAALAIGVFTFGVVTVHLVADLLPSASLLVAVLTYTLQIVFMALAFAALSGSDLLDGDLHRGWLGASVIAVTAAWLVTQLVATTRRRIPVYDLPPASDARQATPSWNGGER
jgi:ATP synthase protein I